MDNEFEKLHDHIPMLALNILAVNDHVGDVECRMRVIKEHSCDILCMLPYTRIPQNMFIHLLHFVVMWLNNFPMKDGISQLQPPRIHPSPSTLV
jgi:hypothetical protein